jgi:hypothetical protein
VLLLILGERSWKRRVRSGGEDTQAVDEGCSTKGSSARFARVPAKPNEPKYNVGDRVQITLNNKIVDATITAIVRLTKGVRLQVAYGHDLTALIYEWQVVRNKL